MADVPFVSRLYSESTFGTMQAGAMVRFTSPNNPLGVGIVAFYRWYLDKQNKSFINIFSDDEDNDDSSAGFRTSDDPHGFILQSFAGRCNERLPTIFPNQPPTVTLTASSGSVTLAAEYPVGQNPDPNRTPTANTTQLSSTATDPDGDTLLYTYSTPVGRSVAHRLNRYF